MSGNVVREPPPVAWRGEQIDPAALDLITLPAVLEERIEINGIPAKLYRPTGAQGILLLGHGGAKSKDSDRFVSLSRLYAGSRGVALQGGRPNGQ